MPEANSQPVYGSDNRGWAARLGASYTLSTDGRTVLRGGSGILYERPYDNLWLNAGNNNVSLAQFFIAANTTNYLTSAAEELPQFAGQPGNAPFPSIAWITARIRNATVWSSFLGVQQELARHLILEWNGLETLGRGMIANEVLNRGANTNSALPEIDYLANQGSSTYIAATALLRPVPRFRSPTPGAIASIIKARRWPAITSTFRSSTSRLPTATSRAPHSRWLATPAWIAATPISINGRTWF